MVHSSSLTYAVVRRLLAHDVCGRAHVRSQNLDNITRKHVRDISVCVVTTYEGSPTYSTFCPTRTVFSVPGGERVHSPGHVHRMDSVSMRDVYMGDLVRRVCIVRVQRSIVDVRV